MKIHKKCLIEKAASQDATRSAICQPYLDVTNAKGSLVATDGRILACIPVEIETADDAGFVSDTVLKAARKASAGENATMTLAGQRASIAGSNEMPRANEGQLVERFPNWRQVVPAMPDAPAFVVSLDAKLLWQLAQAMGTTGVQLVFTDNSKPIHVIPAYTKDGPFACADARGVIMPISQPKK